MISVSLAAPVGCLTVVVWEDDDEMAGGWGSLVVMTCKESDDIDLSTCDSLSDPKSKDIGGNKDIGS
jgi:hypothetical protein